MKVINSMMSSYYRAEQNMLIWDLGKGLLKSGQDTAPVVDEAGHLMGLVGIHDIFEHVLPNYIEMDEVLMEMMHEGYFEERIRRKQESTASDLMITDTEKMNVHDPVIRAVAVFVRHRRRLLPVVDDKNVLQGIITRTSVLQRLYEKIEKNEV